MSAKKAKTTKKKIVSAAWKLFYEQGYEVVSVSELIGRDNIKPGTKYYGAN